MQTFINRFNSKLFLITVCILMAVSVNAQVARTQTVMLSAAAVGSKGIMLKWPADFFTGKYELYKRTDLTIDDWGSVPFVTLPSTAVSFYDSTVNEGSAAEYFIAKLVGSTAQALGVIYAGNKLTLPINKGAIILLIDSNYIIPLANELKQLQTDLENEGKLTYLLYAGRGLTPPQVKAGIQAIYNNTDKKETALFIIGHVPVPYSGNFSSTGAAPPPDGHVEGSGNHTGAWPADLFYGDLTGIWTDDEVTCTTGALPRNFNIPNDGKFDQTKVPGTVTLEVGRIDLYDMPLFAKNDTLLVKQYLVRNHKWRTGLLNATERALIDNNFTSFNLASSGYANFSALVPYDCIFANRDYLFSQKQGSYLWSYGCGAGSYTNCSGIGSTSDLTNDSFSNVFTMLAGSFFGDWDSKNNFLKAPLATSSLASFLGGIPKWYVHHMGLGKSIGFGTRLTQNNVDFYYNGGFNSSSHSVHIALMGDPTLVMRNLMPPVSLTAQSINRKVYLNWKRSLGIKDGYHIYRVDSMNNYIQINLQIITDTFYTDDKNYRTGNYTYAVRAIKLETTASGSYYNASGAAINTVNHVNSTEEYSKHELNIDVYPNPSQGRITMHFEEACINLKDLLISDLTGKVVYKTDGEKTCENNFILVDLGSVETGIYLISGTISNKKFVKKLVVIN